MTANPKTSVEDAAVQRALSFPHKDQCSPGALPGSLETQDFREIIKSLASRTCPQKH